MQESRERDGLEEGRRTPDESGQRTPANHNGSGADRSEDSALHYDSSSPPNGQKVALPVVVLERASSYGSSGSRRPRPSPIHVRIDPKISDRGISLNSPRPNPPPSRNGAKGASTREDGCNDNDQDEDIEVEEGMYLRSKLWWFGMILMACGEGGNFLSYGFAPASVVAPLGTVVSGRLGPQDVYLRQALIANCVFAPLILGETFYAKELIGVALAILGAVTVVWSSNSSSPRVRYFPDFQFKQSDSSSTPTN